MKRLIFLVGAGAVALASCTSGSASVALSSPADSPTPMVSAPTGQIVFDEHPQGVEDPEVALIVNTDGTNEHRLSVPGIHPAFSPDGSELSVDTARGPAIVKPDGSGFTLLHPDIAKLGFCIWSPDGKRLLCQLTDRGKLDGLYSIRSSDGGGFTRLTFSPNHDVSGSAGECGGADIPGDYSPDGTMFVFVRQRCGTGADPSKGEAFALFVENTDGTGLRRITPYGPNGDPSWSPDGSEILFGSDCSLYVVHPAGTDLTKIPEDSCSWSPDWSPDGNWMVFSYNHPEGAPALFAAWPDGTHLIQITPHTPEKVEFFADWGAASSSGS